MPSTPSLPEVLSWQQRAKSLEPLPGGLSNYFKSLREICTFVETHSPRRDQLESFLRSRFDISHENSRLVVTYLRRVKFLENEAGRSFLGPWTQQWLSNSDDDIVIALIHSRVRFVGEVLEELRTTPLSARELLSIANDKYGFAWKTTGSVSSRRGWLQSAGFIKAAGGKRFAITEAGRAFLTRLGARESPEPAPILDPRPEPEPASESRPEPIVVPYPRPDDLATEIEEASTDSQNPDRFEQAIRDAFAYLGFRAELMGGSGKTDVLLVARLGRSDSYKVTVDAKTTASGHLSDLQVDWATLVEHRNDEAADHSLLVGPNPRGVRLFNRAVDHKVTVLSAHQLAELCRRHARAPLGLDDYRLLFTTRGKADLSELNRRAEDSLRLREVATDICQTLADRWDTVGYHTARDLWMLRPQAASEKNIQSVLDTLASPLVGAIHGDSEKGYVLASDPEVARLRLALLGEELTNREAAR